MVRAHWARLRYVAAPPPLTRALLPRHEPERRSDSPAPRKARGVVHVARKVSAVIGPTPGPSLSGVIGPSACAVRSRRRRDRRRQRARGAQGPGCDAPQRRRQVGCATLGTVVLLPLRQPQAFLPQQRPQMRNQPGCASAPAARVRRDAGAACAGPRDTRWAVENPEPTRLAQATTSRRSVLIRRWQRPVHQHVIGIPTITSRPAASSAGATHSLSVLAFDDDAYRNRTPQKVWHQHNPRPGPHAPLADDGARRRRRYEFD